MEAKRIRSYQTRNNEYESDYKSLNKSINKTKPLNEQNYSRSKSGNKKESVSPLREKNQNFFKINNYNQSKITTAMGSKLDEINKNIQLEKKKLRTNCKSNVYENKSDNSITNNSVMNNGNCHQNFAASNQHRIVMSGIDANKFQNRNYEENSINISNQNNLMNLKFLRNKSPNSNLTKNNEESGIRNKIGRSPNNSNNFKTGLSKNNINNNQNSININNNYNSNNLINQSNFTFFNMQEQKDFYYNTEFNNNNPINTTNNHNYYSYTENSANIKKNLIELNNENFISNKNINIQNLNQKENSNSKNNYQIQNSDLENYKKKLLGNINVGKENLAYPNQNQNVNVKGIEEQWNLNFKRINNYSGNFISSTKNNSNFNNIGYQPNVLHGEYIKTHNNLISDDNSFEMKRRNLKKSPEFRNKSMISMSNYKNESLNNKTNKIFNNKDNINQMLTSSQRKNNSPLFYNSNTNQNVPVSKEKQIALRNLTPNNYSKNNNKKLIRDYNEINNSRSKSNKRPASNISEHPRITPKEISSKDLLNNSHIKNDRLATSKNKNSHKISTSKSPAKSPKQNNVGNYSNLKSRNSKTGNRNSENNIELSNSKGRDSNKGDAININNSNYNFSYQSTMKQNKNLASNFDSDPNLNFLNKTNLKNNSNNKDLNFNNKNHHFNQNAVNYSNVTPDQIFSKSNAEKDYIYNHNIKIFAQKNDEDDTPYNFQPYKSAFDPKKDARGLIFPKNINKNCIQNPNNDFNQSFSGKDENYGNYINRENLQGSLIKNNNFSSSNGSVFMNNLNSNIKTGMNIQELNTDNNQKSILLNFESKLKKFNKINLESSNIVNNDDLQINELENKVYEKIQSSENSNFNLKQKENSIFNANSDPTTNKIGLNFMKLNNSILKNLNLKEYNKNDSINSNNKNSNSSFPSNSNKNALLNNFYNENLAKNDKMDLNNSKIKLNPCIEKDINFPQNSINNVNSELNTNLTTHSSGVVFNNPNISNLPSLKNIKNLNITAQNSSSNSNNIFNNINNKVFSSTFTQNQNTNFNQQLKNYNKQEINLQTESNSQMQSTYGKSLMDFNENPTSSNNNLNTNSLINTNTYTNTNSNLQNVYSIGNQNNLNPVRNTSSYNNTTSTYNYDENKNSETNKVKHIEELHLELVRMIQNYNFAVRVQEKENEDENNMQTVNKCEEKDIN